MAVCLYFREILFRVVNFKRFRCKNFRSYKARSSHNFRWKLVRHNKAVAVYDTGCAAQWVDQHIVV